MHCWSINCVSHNVLEPKQEAQTGSHVTKFGRQTFPRAISSEKAGPKEAHPEFGRRSKGQVLAAHPVHPSPVGNSSLPSISFCSRHRWQRNSRRQQCSWHADPDRRGASLAVPWQPLRTQEKLPVPSTFVLLELDRPSRLHTIWCSNGVVVCTLASAKESQEDDLTPTTLCADLARVSACRIHMTFCPNGATTRRKLLRVMIPRHCATQTSSQLIPKGPNHGLHLLHSSFRQAATTSVYESSWAGTRLVPS